MFSFYNIKEYTNQINHQTWPRDSPDDLNKSTKKIRKIFLIFFDKSILLKNLSQTAYFNGLKL